MIPTPNGFTRLSDLQPGDFVFGRDGQPHVILAESETVTAPAYRLTFDDGAMLVAHEEHRWLTFDGKELGALTRLDDGWRERRRDRRASRVTGLRSERFTAAVTARNRRLRPPTISAPCGSVRTTAEIAATLHTPRGRRNHAIPVAEPLELPERALPLDPYVLGVWLGDGSKHSADITTADTAIVEAVVAAGFSLRRTAQKPNNQAATYTFNGLRAVLKCMGLIDNKYIPESYLWASREQRLALLQGLMDTDGGIGGGSAEFTNTRQCLAEGVAHLARTLGHKATVRPGTARLNGRDIGPKWTVKFAARMPVFRLARKADRLTLATRRTTSFRYVVSAERVEPVAMKCIRVSSADSLYLAGEHLIPTHNSSALLMSALQYVTVPNYAALIVRRTFPMLSKPDSIMDRAHQWLRGKVRWDEEKHTYMWPNGAKLVFGHLQYEKSIYDYQGAAFQFIGPDELTQFSEAQYRYLFSRLRRLEGSNVPIRMRPASNPGGEGHEWVFERFFVRGKSEGRVFVPAKLTDNPYLDQDEYKQSLSELDPLTRAQLLDGLWVVDQSARWYKREWWRGQNRYHTADQAIQNTVVARWLSYDTALKDTKSAAYSACTVGELTPDYRLLIRRVWREKLIFPDLLERIERDAAQHNRDNKLRGVVIEDKVSGTSAIQTLSSAGPDWLRSLLIAFNPGPHGGKGQRAQQAAVWAKLGCVLLPYPSDDVPWLADFEGEIFAVPDSENLDQADSFAQLILYVEHLLSAGHTARQSQGAA